MGDVILFSARFGEWGASVSDVDAATLEVNVDNGGCTSRALCIL